MFLLCDSEYRETIHIKSFEKLKHGRWVQGTIANPALLVATLLGNASRSLKSSKKNVSFQIKIPQTCYVVKKRKMDLTKMSSESISNKPVNCISSRAQFFW